jgi:hypothetical protein
MPRRSAPATAVPASRLAPPRALALAIPLVLASCAGEPPRAASPPPSSPPVASSVAPAPSVAHPPVARPRFENPGGMWMPHQMVAHAAKLAELGLAIDPAELSRPTSDVLSAVISLGGCSASFVSAEGLVATNHHCATGALQQNSTPEHNLLKEGFLAKTRADEKSNGPQARVYVTRAVTDVTAKVTDGLAAIADDRARDKAIEKHEKEIVAACEKGRPDTRCSVASFYEGASYYLTEQLEIRDVRLVWAPPAGVGNFGGEIDNWRWPRHGGDVSLFRAYVGKDGKPADYSPDNVPYRPAHFLRIAKDPLREGDLVMVAGYPGHTSSLKTHAVVAAAIEWGYPRRQKLYEDYLARLEAVTKGDKQAQIRATSYIRRFGNVLTNVRGQLEGLVKGGLAADKANRDKELRAFIDADGERRAKWGGVLDDIDKTVAGQVATRDADAWVKDEVQLPALVNAAMVIVRMAEERNKPDAERDPAWQARNWHRYEQSFDALDARYDRKVDEALLGLALERAARMPEAQRSPGVAMITKDTSAAGIQKAVAALYAGTKLGDAKTRLALLTKATTPALAKSNDPLVKLAVALRPLVRQADERAERYAGRMAVLEPKVIEAMRAFRKEPFAPDANGTLRITYGTVRGYRPKPDAPLYRPFTVLSEVVAKDKGEAPFDVPAPLLEAYRQKKLGPYVDAALGEVPVDFLSDLHITGGNSGSATLNAKGELVGLAFDGNYEAMASDWVFMPAISRTIHVDFRYVAWLLDAVFGGDHLLREMGLEPHID